MWQKPLHCGPFSAPGGVAERARRNRKASALGCARGTAKAHDAWLIRDPRFKQEKAYKQKN